MTSLKVMMTSSRLVFLCCCIYVSANPVHVILKNDLLFTTSLITPHNDDVIQIILVLKRLGIIFSWPKCSIIFQN